MKYEIRKQNKTKQPVSQLLFFAIFFFITSTLQAGFITATPGNYTSFLAGLAAGDTLYLTSGTYTGNLTLNNINGTNTQPIVIVGEGNATLFEGQSCCNTISITQCSYVTIMKLKLDGLNKNIDAVKAEGSAGNWAHHITLEYLTIINYNASQQNVGISTKCSAWNWLIRKNKISDTGTGMYLGNSAGDKPFVNGIIEYNYIGSTTGYYVEIKHQLDSVRDDFPGTSVNGKTIIRHNVFTKDSSSSTGGSARPNLLVGGFPPAGWGSMDYYEIYGNFFCNNPVEALFQGTGNIMLYENIFVNHFNPAGYRAVYITPQNTIQPQDVRIFHNTVWAANTSGGIRMYNANNSYQQYCYGNAVFSTLPITNISDTLHNVTDTYANAGLHVLSATTNVQNLNLYPGSGQLYGLITPSAIFQNLSAWNNDFNGDAYNWTYRGAYSGCCINPGWQLQLDTMVTLNNVTAIESHEHENDVILHTNPFTDILSLQINNGKSRHLRISLYDLNGKTVYGKHDHPISNGQTIKFDAGDLSPGIYFMEVSATGVHKVMKIIKQ